MWGYRLGAEKAKRMLFTVDEIHGHEVEQLGLVLQSVPEDTLDAEVKALADRMLFVPKQIG